jgi:hypothetical protein
MSEWSELCVIEPELRRLVKEARLVGASLPDDGGYSAMAYWYGDSSIRGLKHRMLKLVGWLRDHPVLGTQRAYDVAYDRLFSALSGGKGPSPRVVRERAKMSPKKRFSILQRDGFRCRYCGIHRDELRCGNRLVVDHIIPIARGGTSDDDNLCCACQDCNAGKGARQLEEATTETGGAT